MRCETFRESYKAAMKHPEEISELNGKQQTLWQNKEEWRGWGVGYIILPCVNHSGTALSSSPKQCHGDANGTARHD